MTAVQDAPAKEIGRDRRRKEDQRLITGRTRWTDNITLPGMLHLAMVRSPYAHAKILSIDTAAAKTATTTRTRSMRASRGRQTTPPPSRRSRAAPRRTLLETAIR